MPVLDKSRYALLSEAGCVHIRYTTCNMQYIIYACICTHYTVSIDLGAEVAQNIVMIGEEFLSVSNVG